MGSRPEVLIEKWFPIETIGAESMRERGASSALPPLYFLHVWWARRPLLVSRAAILASVLPVWRADWPKPLRAQFPNEESYHAWFLRLCGILGDPVAGRKLIRWANERGIKLESPPYKHKRAFTVSPSVEDRALLGQLLEHTWGSDVLGVLDPFAGGGSIPFEALRYGFKTYANELNPVAVTILKATLDYPFRFGPALAEEIARYGAEICARVRARLEPYFPTTPGESIFAYLWARTVRCPYTGKPIPLSPNWWLVKGTDPIAVNPVFDPNADEARFEIVTGKRATARLKPDLGTVRKGDAVSPWAHGQPVDGDYIKDQARRGLLGQQLIAVAIKRAGGFEFKAADKEHVRALETANQEFVRSRPRLETEDLIPNEEIGEVSNYERGHRLYGISHWSMLFTSRQLLSLGTYVAEHRAAVARLQKNIDDPVRAGAVATYLGFALDKAVDYNSRMARWDGTRNKIANTFDQHNFTYKWSHAEFDAARNLFPWAVEQVADAVSGLTKLATNGNALFQAERRTEPVTVVKGDAKDLRQLSPKTVHLICVDPPYYDNVMYAELADFFYVWLKRTAGPIHPGVFDEHLTNKDDEAIANQARFKDHGKKRKELAFTDYQRKMLAAFREMHRVLTDDGVLTVMFTHKKVEAWDTLATSLIGAGFAIRSSWPVHTESEHSLHQAKKNAAQSTILLTCRKREPRSEAVWWDDIKGEIRKVARQTAEQFEQVGIRGVDLYIATFGPTLAVLSEHWPVLTAETDERTGKPKELRPEIALDLAREEVIRLRKDGLLLGRAVEFDPVTDWYLMAWDAFKAEEFPADEARKLALALGLDLEADIVHAARVAAKKSASVVLQEPALRRRKGAVDPDQRTFSLWVDAAHTAMLVYLEDGAKACEAFLKRSGLLTEGTFRALLQSLINAVPRVKRNGEFVRPEARALDGVCVAFFPDIEIPVEEEPEIEPSQGTLWGETDADEAETGDEEDEEES